MMGEEALYGEGHGRTVVHSALRCRSGGANGPDDACGYRIVAHDGGYISTKSMLNIPKMKAQAVMIVLQAYLSLRLIMMFKSSNGSLSVILLRSMRKDINGSF